MASPARALAHINSSASSTVPSSAIKKGISWKKILGIIGILMALFVFVPLLYNVISDLINPVASITDVQAYYDTRPLDLGGELYHIRFTLRDKYNHYTTSDGTVNIKIALDNDVLYEETFAVYKDQVQKGSVWPGFAFWFYEVDLSASDVPELRSVLEDYARAGRNVTAIATFTTPQGKAFSGTDYVWDPRAWGS